MTQSARFTFSKEERIVSKKTQDTLFNGGRSRSLTAFPLRAVFFATTEDEAPLSQIMVSVPKRHLKRANKRNRCKRQVREAYRLQKHILQDAGVSATVAFIWLDDELHPTDEVFKRVGLLLHRIAEGRYRR